MNIVRFGKDAFKKTIGIPQQVARFFGDQDSRRTASMQNALQGAPVDGNKIDFAAQTEQLKEAAQLGPQQPSMGRRVLTSFLDYAKSPEGQQSLMDLASIVLASQKSDPFEASAITQQLQETIKQRPILEQQRLKREQAQQKQSQQNLEDILNLQLKQAEIKKIEGEPETAKQKVQDKKIESYSDFIRDQKAKGISLIKKEEKLDQIPDQFKQAFTNPKTGKKEFFIDRKGLAKRKDETNKTITYRKNIKNKNNRLLKNVIGKLITENKEGETVFTEVGSEMTTNPAKQIFDRYSINPNFRDMEGLLKTLKANLGFDQLQAMRDASPTGGALGQVSERELDFLQSAAGALDIGMSKEKLITSLSEIRESLERLNKAQSLDYNSIFMGEELRENKTTNKNPLGI